ncbi:MAG: hypothetical protein IID42_11570 [Planctomycetes bacterium]|nr:hypothetical protein [Planctomycetota bacterium]
MTHTVSYIYMAAAMGAVAVGVLVLLRFKTARPYYPFLFAVFPVVSFAGRNFGFVYWVDCLLAAAAVCTGTSVVWFAGRLLFREKERRALFTLGVVGVFWGAAPTMDGFRSIFGFDAMFSTVQLIVIALPLGAFSLGNTPLPSFPRNRSPRASKTRWSSLRQVST